MDIDYSISLWNFSHYSGSQSLEDVLNTVEERGFGVEVWRDWRGQRDLFQPEERQALEVILRDMPVSLHTCGPDDRDEHFSQIDAAEDLGATSLVLHPGNVSQDGGGAPDIGLLGEITSYGQEKGVQLVLENGPLGFLVEAAGGVPELGICLDVGHVYFEEEPMSQFLDELKSRLMHLHIQDILPEEENGLPGTGSDHYIPGTGGIPARDWELIKETLEEIDYIGRAVFEIRPRNPWQTALLGKKFMGELI